MSRILFFLWVGLGGILSPLRGAAQEAGLGALASRPASEEDSLSAHRFAKNLQARFERTRLRHLPVAKSGASGECDEVIGRFCVWDSGRDDWRPRPEDPEITEARFTLLNSLDSLAAIVPGDHFILGQRVRYLIEADRWDEAVRVTQSCEAEAWRCLAHRGLALHVAQKPVEALQSFESALATMPEEKRSEWRDLSPLLDSDGEDWLADQGDSTWAREVLWALADPFFLVPGNDRLTGHYSRWTYATGAAGSLSPHQLRWADDLTKIVVRFGWPAGWERPWPHSGSGSQRSAIGHDDYGSLPFFPPTSAFDWMGTDRDEDKILEAVVEAPRDWLDRERRLPAIYSPPYVDSVAPMQAQVARFWPRESSVTVAAAFGPTDGQQGAFGTLGGNVGVRRPQNPGVAGVFVVPVSVREPDHASGEVSVYGATNTKDPTQTLRLSVDVPSGGEAILSLELLHRADSVGFRERAPIRLPQFPPDVLSLSDVVLVDTLAVGINSRESLISAMRPSVILAPLEVTGLGFEVYGLGFRGEDLRFMVRMRKLDKGFFARAGSWLRIIDGEDPFGVSWTEPGPENPGAVVRAVAFRIPDVDEGRYEIVVEVEAPGRTPVRTSRVIQVLHPTSGLR